jgi:hypothetical protein
MRHSLPSSDFACRLEHVNMFAEVKHEVFSLDFLLETTKVRAAVVSDPKVATYSAVIVSADLSEICEVRGPDSDTMWDKLKKNF